MSTYEIPLTPEPQSFRITLAGVEYSLVLSWNEVSLTWVLDIKDSKEIPLLSGIPLVTGVDLLFPYPYLNFGGELRVSTDGEFEAIPTQSNLGTISHLYFVT